MTLHSILKLPSYLLEVTEVTEMTVVTLVTLVTVVTVVTAVTVVTLLESIKWGGGGSGADALKMGLLLPVSLFRQNRGGLVNKDHHQLYGIL